MSCNESNKSDVLKVPIKMWYANNPGCTHLWEVALPYATRVLEFDSNTNKWETKVDANATISSPNNESCHINVQR